MSEQATHELAANVWQLLHAAAAVVRRFGPAPPGGAAQDLAAEDLAAEDLAQLRAAVERTNAWLAAKAQEQETRT